MQKNIIFIFNFSMCVLFQINGAALVDGIGLPSAVIFDEGTILDTSFINLKQKKSTTSGVSATLSYWLTKKVIIGVTTPYFVSRSSCNIDLQKGFGDISIAAGYKFYDKKDLKCLYTAGIDAPSSKLCSGNPFSTSTVSIGQSLTVNYEPKRYALYVSSLFEFFVPRKAVKRGLLFNTTIFAGYKLAEKEKPEISVYALGLLFFNYQAKDKCKAPSANCPFICFDKSILLLLGPSLYLQTKHFYSLLVAGFPVVQKTSKKQRIDSVIGLYLSFNF